MPRKKNNAPPVMDVEPGENAKIIHITRMAARLPKIDISDAAQVQERLEQYLDACEQWDLRPSAVGMANWLGVSTQTVKNWRDGVYRSGEHRQVIEAYFGLMENILVEYMMEGKVNPVSGIYLTKVFHGYKEPSAESRVSTQQVLTESDAERLVREAKRLQSSYDSDENSEDDVANN